MKITVITDKSGKIVGTMSRPEQPPAGPGQHPTSSVQAVPGSGQKAIELDLPNDVVSGSAEELHKAVTKHLGGKK